LASPVTFHVEPLKQCWDEVVGLAGRHWAETQNYRHEQPFCPQFERYNQYNELGLYIQFTARCEGKLVGYGGVYIVPSMHTQQLICTEDTWYLAPEFRQGWTAMRFFKFMEREAAARGAVDVTLTAPDHTGIAPLHRRLGYKKVADVHWKSLRVTPPQGSPVPDAA